MINARGTHKNIRAAVAVLALSVAAITAVNVFARADDYPSDAERLIWKYLGTWGDQDGDTATVNNTPASAGFVTFGEEDPYTGQEIRYSETSDFDLEYAKLGPGECTFSQNGDFNWDDPLDRQCRPLAGPNVPEPPPLGALLLPVALATDTVDVGTPGSPNIQHRVYVADGFNHRIQAFTFEGAPLPMEFPIGSGRAGIGHYSYPGGSEGQLLSLPYGIAVEAQHRLLVADGGNQRIAIFNSNGSVAFPDPDTTPGDPDNGIHWALPAGVSGADAKPNQVRITPGATVLLPGSTPSSDPDESRTTAAQPDGLIPADDRIVVTDFTHCFVYIYDTGFNLKKTLPSLESYQQFENNTDNYQALDSACLNPQSGYLPDEGEFGTLTGAAVDEDGHIYLADHVQNVVQVFDRDGEHLGWIGRPGQASGAAVLNGPVGVTIDHLGRVAVTDAGNARVAFYTVTFDPDTGAPTASFEFQLDTTVAVDDFTMGLAEQTSIDPMGRFIATDPLRRRVIRFELPELAIANALASMLPESQDGQGSFDVFVPTQKGSPVPDVDVDVQPAPGSEGDVSNIVITPSTSQTIPNGSFMSYTFTFTSTLEETNFVITATAPSVNEGATTDAVARANCAPGCAAAHTIHADPVPDDEAVLLPASPDLLWYNQALTVRIRATAPENPDDPNDAVDRIFWRLAGAAAAGANGSSSHTTPLSPDGYVDIQPLLSGVSQLYYQPLTVGGAVGAETLVDLWIDVTPPGVEFSANSWTPAPHEGPGGIEWYGRAIVEGEGVKGTYTVIDNESGPATPTGFVQFSDEGRDQIIPFEVEDNVGNVTQADSLNVTFGRLINIDLTPPEFQTYPDLTVVATGQDQNGPFADVAEGDFEATASDPDMPDADTCTESQWCGDGSGVASIVSNAVDTRVQTGDEVTFTATDYAGNSAPSAGLAVTVVKATSAVSSAPYTVVYGQELVLSANVGVDFAGGEVTFTFGPEGQYEVTAPVINGLATVTIAAVTAPASTTPYELTVSYSGDNAVEASETTATVTVTKATATVTVPDATKVYGEDDPAFTADADGFLEDDDITITVSREGGETVAGSPYAITATVSGSDVGNYDITIDNGVFTITKATPVITWENPADIVYGTPLSDTQLNATVEDEVAGTLTYTPPSGTVLNAGNGQTLSVSFAPDDSANYNTAEADVQIDVLQATPTIDWSDPADIVYGTALSSTQLNAEASTGGSFAYTPPSGTVLNAGENQTLSVVFTPADQGNYTTANAAVEIDVLKATPGITLVGGVFTYDGQPHPAVCTVTLAVGPPVSGDITYTPGGSSPPVNPFVYVVECSYAGDANHNGVTAVPTTLTILPSTNSPPVAIDDAATTSGTNPVNIPVLANDTDLNETDVLTVASVTQPAGGTVVISADSKTVTFTANPGFVGPTTFTYIVSDGHGGSDEGTVTVTVTAPQACSIVGYTTYSQGGWGAPPNGNNPGQLLHANFSTVYPGGQVVIGGTYTLTFTSAGAITAFLPAGGTPGVLTSNATNPSSSSAGNFAAQVLALRLAVDFSAAGVKKVGLGQLVMVSGPFAGSTVNQVLAVANAVLGGQTTALPPGMSISTLNGIIESLNLNFHEGTANNGLLRCPGTGTVNRAPDAMNDSASTPKNTSKTIAVLANDTDPDGNSLTISSFVPPPSSKGTVTMNAAKTTLTFKPKKNFVGIATFTYTISDGNGGSDTATVTVTVTLF